MHVARESKVSLFSFQVETERASPPNPPIPSLCGRPAVSNGIQLCSCRACGGCAVVVVVVVVGGMVCRAPVKGSLCVRAHRGPTVAAVAQTLTQQAATQPPSTVLYTYMLVGNFRQTSSKGGGICVHNDLKTQPPSTCLLVPIPTCWLFS